MNLSAAFVDHDNKDIGVAYSMRVLDAVVLLVGVFRIRRF